MHKIYLKKLIKFCSKVDFSTCKSNSNSIYSKNRSQLVLINRLFSGVFSSPSTSIFLTFAKKKKEKNSRSAFQHLYMVNCKFRVSNRIHCFIVNRISQIEGNALQGIRFFFFSSELRYICFEEEKKNTL